MKTGSRIEFNYLLNNKNEYITERNGNTTLVDNGGLNISYHVTTVIDVKSDGSFLTISSKAGEDLTHPYFEHWKSLDDLIKHENYKVNNLLKMYPLIIT